MFSNVKVWKQLAPSYLGVLALVFSLNSTWRIPRDALRYGGLSFGIVVTAALLLVAMPVVLLQMSIGQLSQQDSVGVWKAVPFFKGVGYLRLLITFIASICAIVYTGTSATLLLYTTNNPIPFYECTVLVEVAGEEPEVINYNATLCFSKTFFAAIHVKPEYYITLSLVIVFIWIIFPFMLYRLAKSLRRTFYAFGPATAILWLIILSATGNKASLGWFSKTQDWVNLLKPDIWNKAISQALLTAQVAGGFIISSGYTIFAISNVEWTTLSFIGCNIISVWLWLIFWFALGNSETGNGDVFAVLARTYNYTIEENLIRVWPIFIFATLFLSGFITMVSLLYPLYDRFHRIAVDKWRYISIASSFVGSGLALAALVDHTVLILLEDTVLPFLVNITTIIEVSAFIFVYGWKVLLHDMEFLTGRESLRFWVWGLCGAPGIILPILLWWYITRFLNEPQWTQAPWESSGLVAVTIMAIIIFLILAIYSVSKQVQYDVISKIKASVQPSRNWGPSDPRAHYFWMLRRDEVDSHAPRSRYQRRVLGQFSGTSTNLSTLRSKEIKTDVPIEIKRRSNSDDWLYNYRKEYLTELFRVHHPNRRRSKSLEWPRLKRISEEPKTATEANSTNHTIIIIERSDQCFSMH